MSSKQPQLHYFVAQRDVAIVSLAGRRIVFEKGVPTHVPKVMHTLVLERGLMPCDEKGNTLDVDKAVEIEDPKSNILLAPETKEERDEAIEAAIAKIVKANDPKDFAGGTPSASAVTAIVGWKADQKEIRKVWERVRAKYLSADPSAVK